jgi:hypothetical protein
VGLTQTKLGSRPNGGGVGLVTGSRDGGVTSCLVEERVVATRQGRWAQLEDGMVGGDAGKSPGHGRG